MICHLGTFDVENYGDLLYPIVLRHLLKTKHPNLHVQQYSLLAGAGPHEAEFETRSIRSLFQNGLGHDFFLTRACEAKARVYQLVDEMMKTLGEHSALT